jgi:hypothetical protein
MELNVDNEGASILYSTGGEEVKFLDAGANFPSNEGADMLINFMAEWLDRNL